MQNSLLPRTLEEDGGSGNINGTSGQLAYFNGAKSIISSNSLRFDGTTLKIGSDPTYFNPTSIVQAIANDNTSGVGVGNRTVGHFALQLNQSANTDGTYSGFQFYSTNAGASNGAVFSNQIYGSVTTVNWVTSGITANNGLIGHLSLVTVNNGTVGGNAIAVTGNLSVTGSAFINNGYGVVGRMILSGSPVATNLASIWARPAFVSGFTGTIIGTVYGAKIDNPGITGATQFTMAVDTGNSYIAGSVAIGKSTAPLAHVDILQPDFSSGLPIALLLKSGTHSALDPGNGYIAMNVDLTNPVEFSTGDQNAPIIGAYYQVGTTYSFLGASTIPFAGGVVIDGLPQKGTNATIVTAVSQFLTGGSTQAQNIITQLIAPSGISGNFGNATEVSAQKIDGTNVNLGNQNATLDILSGYHIAVSTYVNFGGNTRTVAKAASLLIDGAPINGGGVAMTPYALYVVQDTSRFGGIVQLDDELKINTLGKGISIKEGANGRMGSATLVGGTVTVNTTAVTANSRIFLTGQNSSGTHGELTISARVAGTSFTITSSSILDTRAIAWEIKEPL